MQASAIFRNFDPDTDHTDNNFTTGAGLGGAGIWDNGIRNNWTTPPAMPDSPWSDAAMDDAIFWGPAGGIVQLSSPRTARSLTIRTDGYTFNDSTLTLAGGSGIIDVQASSSTINSALAGSTGLTKSGPGTLTLATNVSSFTGPINVNLGVLSIDHISRLNSSSTGTGTITIRNGATLRNTNTSTVGTSFVSANHPIAIGAGGGKVDVTVGPLIYAGTITGEGNALTKQGAGEFRYQGAGTANSTFSKLIVNEGLFRLGNVSGNNHETGFGAAPAAFDADAIELNNGAAIGTSYSATLHVNRGITIGAGGGMIDVSAANMTVPGAITGGPLRIGGVSVISHSATLGGINTHAGTTIADANTLRISADANLGTGGIPLTIEGGTLSTTAAVTSARNINVIGSGSLTPSAAGAAFGNIEAGTAFVNLLGPGDLTVSRVRGGTLIVNGGTFRISPGGGTAKTSTLSSVSLGAGRSLDLADNNLVLRAMPLGGWTGTKYDGVTGLVQAGYGDGSWNGAGIVTIMSDATASVLTTLAVARAGDVLEIAGTQTAVWSGQTVNGNATLVMYTWGGDAELDGDLDGDDYFWIDSNVASTGSVFGYTNGDFDYNGSIDGDDYFIIDSNIAFAQTQPDFPVGAGFTAVPEPSWFTSLALAWVFAPRRRSFCVPWRSREAKIGR